MKLTHKTLRNIKTLTSLGEVLIDAQGVTETDDPKLQELLLACGWRDPATPAVPELKKAPVETASKAVWGAAENVVTEVAGIPEAPEPQPLSSEDDPADVKPVSLPAVAAKKHARRG